MRQEGDYGVEFPSEIVEISQTKEWKTAMNGLDSR